MLNNKNLKLISVIKKYINNDPELYIKFNHYNRKYTIDELLPYIIEILEDGISFRKIKSYINQSLMMKMNGLLVQIVNLFLNYSYSNDNINIININISTFLLN